ncbi:ADP-ribosyltransferase [Nocardia beijingensis]|uniref:ADP-ribosyltransferase n=1 Tax=Nocardia beijingensis TaxID=95162 RepID=UPI0033A8859C
MTVLGIDPQTYYSTATRLQDAATAWFSAIDAKYGALSSCSSMAGSYSEAREWADAYDHGSAELLRQTTLIAEAAGNFAAVLQTVGYNYAVADHAANITADGTGPDKPAPFPPPVYLCRVPLPSAGGPGNGLVSDSVQLIEHIGITVPDGDTDKLQTVADAWKQIQADPAVTGFPDVLGQIAQEIQQNTAPEISLIVGHLATLRDSANDAIGAFGEFSTSCLDHKEDLKRLRDDLMKELNKLGQELLEELAITIALTVAASVITAGLGAAAGSARAAQIIAKCSAPIRALIDGWKVARKAKPFQLNRVNSLAQKEKELLRLRRMGQEATAPTRSAALSRAEAESITDYTGSAAQYANGPLRAGRPLTPEQQRYVDTLNSALDKLPNHQGPVTRVTDLEPEQIDRYRRALERSEDVTEEAFTSTSPLRNGGGVRDGNTEFRIFSVTGKDITPYSAPGNPEILFKTGTDFKPTRIFTDWSTGRTVIQMTEVPK